MENVVIESMAGKGAPGYGTELAVTLNTGIAVAALDIGEIMEMVELGLSFLTLGTSVSIGSRSFCSANKHIKASLPALCSMQCGRTKGVVCTAGCILSDPKVPGSVKEYRRFSNERLEPDMRGGSHFGSCITPRSPLEYSERS